jgi:DNA-directed RNA polymerase subunit RPC12/RpoP
MIYMTDPIEIRCGKCGKAFQVTDEVTGCPYCPVEIVEEKPKKNYWESSE